MDNNPHAIVEIDGVRWDSWLHKALFQRVSIELATGEASEAVWEIFDPRFSVINHHSKADGIPMATVRAWLGVGDANMGEPVFKGLLARVEHSDKSTAFRCYDMGFRMRLEKKTGYLKGDDLVIIKKLAERNQLMFEGPDDPAFKLTPHKAMPQDAQTDWEHVTERAREAGLVLFVRGDTLFAKQPAKVGTPIVTLTYRKDFSILQQFDCVFKTPENVGGKPKSVKHRGRGRGGRRLQGVAAGGTRGTQHVSLKTDLPQHVQAAATRRASARRDLQREHAFTVSIKTLSPLPKVRPDVRNTIALLEMGNLFSGDYLADKVSHEFAPGHLSTSYDLYRDVKE